MTMIMDYVSVDNMLLINGIKYTDNLCCTIDTVLDLPNNLNIINSFRDLPKNWDGYGADIINPTVIEEAVKLIRTIPVQPEIFPTPNGYIQFEYSKPNGDYLEFKLTDKDITVYINVDLKDDLYHIPYGDKNTINSRVNDFYGC